jgi:hypothetical protein
MKFHETFVVGQNYFIETEKWFYIGCVSKVGEDFVALTNASKVLLGNPHETPGHSQFIKEVTLSLRGDEPFFAVYNWDKELPTSDIGSLGNWKGTQQ